MGRISSRVITLCNKSAWLRILYEMRGDSNVRVETEAALETHASSRAELYRRHAPDALRLAYLLTGNHALAEDLVQEAFVRLFGRLIHLRNADSFGPYLRRTIVNLSRMHFRRARVERAYLNRQAQQPINEGQRLDVDMREDLWQALLRLPGRQRAAIVLHFYEDISEEQASEILRCRPGTYRSLVSRGIAHLREAVLGGPDA